MATDNSETTTRTQQKSLTELSFRDWWGKLRGREAVKEVGEELTIDYGDIDYVCNSCNESIAPTLDDFDDWGKCPHCGNRHSQAVKQQAGRANTVTLVGIISIFTVVGALASPFFLLIGMNSTKKTKEALRRDENRVGHVVDSNGDEVPEVTDRIHDGWTIKSQNANGFTMEQADYGTAKMHLILGVLFCWTLGWANLFYGLYRSATGDQLFVVTE